MAELMGLMHTLYSQADLPPERDTVVFTGDLVDGGGQAKEVIEWCMEISTAYPHSVFLYANHEDLLLDALRYSSRIYGSDDLWGVVVLCGGGGAESWHEARVAGPRVSARGFHRASNPAVRVSQAETVRDVGTIGAAGPGCPSA